MMQTCDLINDVTPEENMDPSTLLLYGAFHFVRTQLGVGMGGGGGGGVQASYTFPLRITGKKGVGGLRTY